jgi:hypothetical protein
MKTALKMSISKYPDTPSGSNQLIGSLIAFSDYYTGMRESFFIIAIVQTLQNVMKPACIVQSKNILLSKQSSCYYCFCCMWNQL